MCGRYLSVSTPEALAERFGVDELRTDALAPRYNVAPSQPVYAVIEREDRRRLGTLRWGFVPHWARSLDATRRPINARIETVATSRMFADAVRRRRCLLPADGFYEWKAAGPGRAKQPYHLAAPDGAPLAFAGIWSVWHDPEQAEAPALSTTAIVTTDARGTAREIHPRMPVIVPSSLWGAWLTADEAEVDHLLGELTALPPPALTATPVSTHVNRVANDGPELLDPVGPAIG